MAGTETFSNYPIIRYETVWDGSRWVVYKITTYLNNDRNLTKV
jgi:hypothetical protein